MSRIVVPKNIEVIVASFGGVGTSFLLDYLSQYKSTNSPGDVDRLKHTSMPPISFNRKVKYIYVYGDPVLATISLFRRGYHHLQSKKLQAHGIRRKQIIPKEMTLEQYSLIQEDRLLLHRSFHNWYTAHLAHPTLFVRYENLFEHKEEIINFLELPAEAIKDFPKKKERSSKIEETDQFITSKLSTLYKELSEEINQLNDIELRVPEKNQNLFKTYLSRPYLQCALNQMLDPRVILQDFNPTLYRSLSRIKG